MGEYWKGFLLGNSAILTNVCVLPLYPGMLTMLSAQDGRQRKTWLLGGSVLAGVVTFIVLIGWVFHSANLVVARVAPWLSPIMYLLVGALGVATLFGKNPFGGASVAPRATKHPMVTAYLYGMALAPLTLPCTGPIIIAGLTVGSVSGTGETIDFLVYFFAFALGFGWPMLALSVMHSTVQRRWIGVLTRHHRRIELASGALMIVVALIGFWNEWRYA